MKSERRRKKENRMEKIDGRDVTPEYRRGYEDAHVKVGNDCQKCVLKFEKDKIVEILKSAEKIEKATRIPKHICNCAFCPVKNK